MKDPIWGYFFKQKETEEAKALKFLAQSPVFEGFSNAELTKVYRIVHTRNYKKDEIIFRSGDPGVGMYIICSGNVDVFVSNTQDEQEDLVAQLIPGQTFGDIALFCESPRSATIKAKTQTTLLGICKPDLMGLISRNPHLGSRVLIKLLGLAGKRLEATNQQLGDSKSELQQLKVQLKKDVTI